MAILTRYEQVMHEHVALYVYSTKLNKFSVFDDVRLIKNTIFPDKPMYYIHHYSGSDAHTEYIVSSNAGEVLNSGGTFKVWFVKADNSVGIKTLIDAIDIYIAEKIKKASDTITKMKKQQNMAHEILDVMM